MTVCTIFTTGVHCPDTYRKCTDVALGALAWMILQEARLQVSAPDPLV